MGGQDRDSVIAGMADYARVHTARAQPHSPEVKAKNESGQTLNQIQMGCAKKDRTREESKTRSESA